MSMLRTAFVCFSEEFEQNLVEIHTQNTGIPFSHDTTLVGHTQEWTHAFWNYEQDEECW